MRRRKQDRYDRRPWAIRDTLGASAEIRSWHKSNAGTLAKMLDERDHQPMSRMSARTVVESGRIQGAAAMTSGTIYELPPAREYFRSATEVAPAPYAPLYGPWPAEIVARRALTLTEVVAAVCGRGEGA